MIMDRRAIMLAALAAGLAPAPARARPLAARVTDLVDAFARDQGFQGVVMLGRRGRPVFTRAAGKADLATGAPATPRTVYAVASISKMLTAVTVLKLVEAGGLDLDAPILRYLPDYRADTGARITLRRLLSNASGVPNLFTTAIKADPTLFSRSMETSEAVKTFCEGDLIFEPGARFDYALTNWIIVLAIVEAVTGQPFQQAMRRISLDPLGLAHTDAAEATGSAPATAISYRTVDPPLVWPNDRKPYMAAAGGYFSTGRDLLRAAHLIFDGAFLAPASRRSLTTVEVASDSYALGGRVRQVAIDGTSVPAAWETGRTAGYRSVLGHRLDGKGGVVVLNNTALSQKTLDEFADTLLVALART